MGSNSVTFQEAAKLIRQGVNPEDVGDVPYIGLEHIEEGTLRLVGIGNAKNVTSTKLRFYRGDILFGKLRPYFRKVIRPDFDGICSTDIWVVRAKQGIDQGYLYYWMASNDFVNFATQGSEGTKMPRAKWEHVGRFQRLRLEESEQRAIAHILGSLDDKIELNRRMNQTLEAMALAIFKSWFVDFDPVRAKAEGRPTGLPDDIAALFPDSFEDSELGSIPKGWEVKKFKQFVTPRNERVEDRDIPEYSSTNEGLFPRTDKFKKQLSKSKAKNKIIRKNDIVFGLSRQILNFGIMKDTIGAVSPAYHVYSINTSTIFSDFVEQYMRKRMHLFYGILGASSREGQSISVQQFYQTRLLIPPKIIQNKFKERTNDFHRSIKHSENEALTLASLRDTLLPKLISGELRVPDAEKFAREAGV